MLSKGRLSFTVAIIAVHFVQAVSFVFGAKKDMHSGAAESVGLFAKAGRFFNKLKRTSAHDSEIDYTTKLGGVLPTQLRSSDVKQSRKQWLPTGGKTAPVAPKSARTVSHIASEISEGQNGEYQNSLEHSYIQDSATSKLSAPGKPDLNNLNDLLRRNKATNDDQNNKTSADKATMSFKIEITPRAAEITVSIGPTHPLVKTKIPTGTQENQAVDKITMLNAGAVDKEREDTASTEVVSLSHNMDEALPGTSGENAGPNLDTAMLAIIDPTNKDIAPPVPFLLFDNNNSDIWSNIYTASNATLLPTTSTMNNNTSTATAASTAMDLSYIALFCFVLGALCTYLLNKLIHSVITWYKGRIPRYIARLERQAISLLSEHRYAEVKALLTQHLPCIEAYKGARHTDVAAFRHFLGKALLALGEHSAACEQLNTVVGIYESYGEDLYMAHALEDLALAQQEHTLHNNENGEKKENNKRIQSTVALTTMQRALRIFTEEALALQALAAQPLNTTTTTGEQEEKDVLKELEEMFMPGKQT